MDQTRTMIPADLIKPFLPVIEALEQVGIPYYIGGSVASSVWGYPRSTNDADIIVDLQPHHVAPFVGLLAEQFYVDAEAIQEAIGRQSSFNVIHFDTIFKVDLFVRQHSPFADADFTRARPTPVKETPDRLVVLASPENTVLHKLLWYKMGGGTSERQWLDVLSVLKLQGPTLDLSYLREWAAQLGIAELLKQALSEASD